MKKPILKSNLKSKRTLFSSLPSPALAGLGKKRCYNLATRLEHRRNKEKGKRK